MTSNVDEMMQMLFKHEADHEIAVMTHIEPLAALLKKDHKEGLKKIREAYGKALQDVYGKDENVSMGYILSLAGGPAESLTWPLYNAIGAVYPYLDRETKDIALKEILGMLDGYNYGIVNGALGVGHTTGIREPLLLSDICIARPLYWPGLKDEFPQLLKKHPTFEEFHGELIDKNGMFDPRKINSDFLVAYAVLRSNRSDFGERYAKVANPVFLDRTMRGIVALRFARDEKPEDIAKGRARLEELLPKSLHPRIEPLRKGGNWADYTKFP